MPRQARLDAPGVLHHVMARGIERRKIFRGDADREDFVGRLPRSSAVGSGLTIGVPSEGQRILTGESPVMVKAGAM